MHYGDQSATIGEKSLRVAFDLNFSYMFQNALFDSMTAAENIALPLRESTKLSTAAIRDRVQDLLNTMDLMGVATNTQQSCQVAQKRAPWRAL